MSQASGYIKTISPKQQRLAQTLSDLFRHEKSGAALPECYGDDTGALTWAHFVRQSDPDVQYTFQSEVNTLTENAAAIAELIVTDPDIDTRHLLLIEKGAGSREARLAKSYTLIDAFEAAGMSIDLYSSWEHSAEYRREGSRLAAQKIPDAESRELDVDFNQEDPDISTQKVLHVERPRVVMEFGSSRGNIATSGDDPRSFKEQTFEELQRRFALDRKNCRDGGILIVGCDANNTMSARDAYTHPVHAKFAENIVHRGAREGVLSAEFNPQLLYYNPVYDPEDHVVKHALVAAAEQSFGVINSDDAYEPVHIHEDDHFVLSHSIKWPEHKMIAAAESQGFKILNVYWGHDRRVPVYVFKAVTTHPSLHVV